MQSSVAFTLPISCQICLGKVKEPVTCSNQHVFCSSCMNVWLDRNGRCPTCRVEITSQSPLRKIIGGVLQSNESKADCRFTARELRRARFEMSLREYEDEINHLQNEIDRLMKENECLKKQNGSVLVNDSSGASSSDFFDKLTQPCLKCCDNKDLDVMLDLTKKLQVATSTYTDMKKQIANLKTVNEKLVKRNDDLTRENQRIRQEWDTRSPMKYGRLTVATLESRLEAALKEVEQLKKAMERNDVYTEGLEQELRSCRTISESIETGNKDLIKNEPANEFALSMPVLESPRQNTLPQNCDPCVSSSDLSHPPFTIASSSDIPCSVFTDESSKASSFFELQSYNEPFNNFVSPAPSVESAPRPSSFSRRLDFDPSDGNIPSTSHLTSDLFQPADNITSSQADHNRILQCPDVSNTNHASSPVVQSSSEKSPWLQPAQVTKTVINAGGSTITMSQLSAGDHDAFSRPSSAPSRTFLLSGSRFSALRPLDPPADSSGFQPVKCISPMHFPSTCAVSSETEKRPTSPVLRMVSPDDVIDAKYRKCDGVKLEDEIRGRETLSRVNILKRRSLVKTPVSSPSFSVVSEGRRKQRLYQKKGVDDCFQSPLKYTKIQLK